MISHDRFGALRLCQFLPDAEIVKLENWEFMERVWIGEALGFSEWLRLEADPELLRSLALDFGDFPEQAAKEVLRTIDLPVSAGMTVDRLRDLFGEPKRELRFARVNDRATYEFVSASSPHYNVSCTVLHDGGLTYLVVMVPLGKLPAE
jgi:hypothetical protein